MRLNQYLARHASLSRRAADKLILNGNVSVNGEPATLGYIVSPRDEVRVYNKLVNPTTKYVTIMINKPAGYICSRKGQGNKTVYDLLPWEYKQLKTVGRLDKDSSGLLLLTNDGVLANQLTHPRYKKQKVYIVQLNKALQAPDEALITKKGVKLEDGTSKLSLRSFNESRLQWQITMNEGRNRQIRRTFAALGYKVTSLHRISFGKYKLGKLSSGQYTGIID